MLKGKKCLKARAASIRCSIKNSKILILTVLGLSCNLLLLNAQNDKKEQEPKTIEEFQAFLDQLTVKDSLYAISQLKLASLLRYQDPGEAIRLGEEAAKISLAIADRKLEGKAKNMLGIFYGMQAQYVEALQVLETAIEIAEEIQFVQLKATALNNQGIIYKQLEDFTQSIQYYRQAWEIYDSINFELGLARGSNNLGNLYKSAGDNFQAEQFYRKALEYYSNLNNPVGYASAQLNLGVLKLDEDSLQQASILLDSTLALVKAHQLISEEVEVKFALGQIAQKQKKLELAERHFIDAIQLARQLKLDKREFDLLTSLARMESEQKNFAQGFELAGRAKVLADTIDQAAVYAQLAFLMADLNKNAGNWKEAYQYYQKFEGWEDSIRNVQAASTYKAQQVQLEVLQKNRELELQNLQLDLVNSQLSAATRWKWFLGIASLLFMIAGFLYYQRYQQKRTFGKQLEKQNLLITQQKAALDEQHELLNKQYQLRKQTDETINYFAASLFGKNTVEEILWDVTKNCIAKLGLEDCVIYLLDPEKQVLVQKAAHGPKNPVDFEIHNPILIPLGKGIVGAVAESGQAEIIKDTSIDPRYIADIQAGSSEMAVPLLQNEQVIGVIDSEHPDKDFFTQYHLDALTTIASITASKIAQARADEVAQQGKAAQLEAAQLKKMDQLKTQFFANVSHELRTPLNLILAPLQKKQLSIPPEEVLLIRRNAKRLLSLVNQLLDLTKIEAGLMKLEQQSIQIYGFLSDLAHSFSLLAESKNINYHIQIPERDYVAQCDPDKLEKIVYNLLANAFKFTPEAGAVSVLVSHENQQLIRIVVADSGIGIAEDQKDHIFNRFYQADNSNTRAYAGTGIGLSLTKELVDLFGGSIQVDSQMGKGSIFTVELPFKFIQETPDDADLKVDYDSEMPEELLGTVAQNLLSDKKQDAPLVLIVEDHEELRYYLKKELLEYYNVVAAKNGVEGFQIAQQHIPDLIVSDVMMPQMDGITMTKQLQVDEKTSHIPLILLTARDDEKTKIEGFSFGAEQYLTKPFDIEELKTRINSLLQKRELLREKFSVAINLPLTKITDTDPDAEFLKKLIEMVEENLDNEQLAVVDLQRATGMSRMQLHRKLKALLNQSASEFIRSIRMQRAAELLSQPGYRVQEVAYKVGFTHLSYFAKCFKERFGVSPSTFSKN